MIDRLELSMFTTKVLDLCPRRNPFVGKPEVIFDRVDAVDQAGANDERRLRLQQYPTPRPGRRWRLRMSCTRKTVRSPT